MTAGRRHRPRGRRTGVLLLALLGCGDGPTAATPACGAPPALPPGEPVQHTFHPNDSRRAGAYIRYYTVQLTAPSVLGLRMTSSEVQPFLYLFDANGRVIAQGYDPRPDADPSEAELTHMGPAGCYLVGASTWRAGTRGAYELMLTVTTP